VGFAELTQASWVIAQNAKLSLKQEQLQPIPLFVSRARLSEGHSPERE